MKDLKLLEENIEKTLKDTGIDKDVLNQPPVAPEISRNKHKHCGK
jgi:hypothetical protein